MAVLATSSASARGVVVARAVHKDSLCIRAAVARAERVEPGVDGKDGFVPPEVIGAAVRCGVNRDGDQDVVRLGSCPKLVAEEPDARNQMHRTSREQRDPTTH